MNDVLTIDYAPADRNGKVVLSLKLADEVLAVEKLKVTDAKTRKKPFGMRFPQVEH